ncbi:uncharacterized protein METZ01_LOCUS229852, partial [marine metagenome]
MVLLAQETSTMPAKGTAMGVTATRRDD